MTGTDPAKRALALTGGARSAEDDRADAVIGRAS